MGSAFLLSACQNDANQATPSASDTVGSGSGSSPYPVEITHKFGTTVVSAPPERIASVGLTEHDAILALGYQPVAVTEWFGEFPYATWPWAEAARQAVDAKPEVMTADGINIEWVAAQRPDLIIAIYVTMDEPMYQNLSKIAPVVVTPAGYQHWGAPWQAELKASASPRLVPART